jgi:pimeloyl-ACP methyl ester carboxylesterase
VGDAAADVRAIADALGLDRFAVVGRSGGAPHALACAALLSGRVTRVAAMVGLAPRDADDLDWYAGMDPGNVAVYRTAELGAGALSVKLARKKDLIKRDPTAALPFRDPGLPEPDRRLIAEFGIRTLLIETVAEAFKGSMDGWGDDILAFSSPWGFELAAAEIPVLLWHGARDVYSPVSHALWLASHIRRTTLVIEAGSAHYGAVTVLPRVLSWLVDEDRGTWLAAA